MNEDPYDRTKRENKRINWGALNKPIGDVVEKKSIRDKVDSQFDKRRNKLIGWMVTALVTCLGSGFLLYEIFKTKNKS